MPDSQSPLTKTTPHPFSSTIEFKPKRYPLAQSTFSEEEIKVMVEVISSGQLTMGEKVKQFENEFAQWTGAGYSLMVNSGSSANLLMVDALIRRSRKLPPLKPGDEVLVPALAWPTTVWPLMQLGLVPVFVDIDPQTLCLDLTKAESGLTDKTKGLFLIHVFGQTPPMNQVLQFCKKYHLILLEDVCESLGTHYDGVHAGNFGLMGSFSCYFSHHLSTIEGGLITTSDEELYSDLLSLRAHGWVRDRLDKEMWVRENPAIDPRFLFVMGGYNVRPTEIQGALGSIQLKKLNTMLVARESFAREVDKIRIKKTPWIQMIGSDKLPTESSATRSNRLRTHSWMTLPFLLTKDSPVSVEEVKQLFENLGVETRPIIAGNLARHPASKSLQIRSATSLENADHIWQRGFMIGCHPFEGSKNLEILEEVFEAASKL